MTSRNYDEENTLIYNTLVESKLSLSKLEKDNLPISPRSFWNKSPKDKGVIWYDLVMSPLHKDLADHSFITSNK